MNLQLSDEETETEFLSQSARQAVVSMFPSW